MPDRDFLLEIGCEEIPARFLPPATEQLETGLRRILAEHRIPVAAVHAYATPCRLVVWARDIGRAADTRVVERTGPPWDAAYGADGRPTAALEGFLKSVGGDANSIVKVQKKDRAFVGVRLKEKGRPTAKILPEILPALIASISFPKAMRWRAGDAAAFARPVRWILCLLHGRPLRFAAHGLESGAVTFGNKFFHPQPFRPASAAGYFRKLEQKMVMVSPAKRREKILRGAKMILARRGLSADLPEDLVTEVVHLTEFPTVLLGGFDRSFLDIPAVILKSAMSHHQRYFPVTAAGGKLAPHFLVVRNGPPDPKGIVAKGNARVLTARFSDTKYFFETDRKKKLADRIDGLKGVVYLEGLGTLHDRARRLRDLLVILPPRIGIDLDLDRYADVAYLCKADLLTEVVREFPELQGVMGRIYAEKEGLPAEIPAAIAEHYQPRGPADPLPETPLGALLALADKFELLFGAYSVGLRPTASGDPYGLRRAAIGIARILLARAWHLRIGQMAESAAPIFPDPGAVRKAAPEVLAFFRARLEALLRETHPAEFVLACLNVSDDPCEIAGKVEAFSKIAREGKDRWVTLLRTAKRAHNIVKNEKNLPPLNPGAFQQEEERALHKAFLDWEAAVRRMPERKYTDRLRAILEMAAPLHTFFDKVFVMVDDASLRANRLSLIGAISDAFRSYAEFDRIAVSE